MKLILILITVFLLLIGCQQEKTAPIVTEPIDNPNNDKSIGMVVPDENNVKDVEVIDEKSNTQVIETENNGDLTLKDVIDTKQMLKIVNIKIPLPASGADFCKKDDSYEGLSPNGVIGAVIIGKVNFKYGTYCKASMKWTKDSITYDYTFYFKENNDDVWLERNIDGKKDLIHLIEFQKPLI